MELMPHSMRRRQRQGGGGGGGLSGQGGGGGGGSGRYAVVDMAGLDDGGGRSALDGEGGPLLQCAAPELTRSNSQAGYPDVSAVDPRGLDAHGKHNKPSACDAPFPCYLMADLASRNCVLSIQQLCASCLRL